MNDPRKSQALDVLAGTAVFAMSAFIHVCAAATSVMHVAAIPAAPAELVPPIRRNNLFCWQEAANRYGVHPGLLYAIADVESSLRPAAYNRAHTASTNSYDIGVMQINSSHLPALAKFGIDEISLIQEVCTNIHVGAWILADAIKRHGNTWNAVGAYNAACRQLQGEACRKARTSYVAKVQRALGKLSAQTKGDAIRVTMGHPRASSENTTMTLRVIQ